VQDGWLSRCPCANTHGRVSREAGEVLRYAAARHACIHAGAHDVHILLQARRSAEKGRREGRGRLEFVVADGRQADLAFVRCAVTRRAPRRRAEGGNLVAGHSRVGEHGAPRVALVALAVQFVRPARGGCIRASVHASGRACSAKGSVHVRPCTGAGKGTGTGSASAALEQRRKWQTSGIGRTDRPGAAPLRPPPCHPRSGGHTFCRASGSTRCRCRLPPSRRQTLLSRSCTLRTLARPPAAAGAAAWCRRHCPCQGRPPRRRSCCLGRQGRGACAAAHRRRAAGGHARTRPPRTQPAGPGPGTCPKGPGAASEAAPSRRGRDHEGRAKLGSWNLGSKFQFQFFYSHIA
jgi:hypothetical protein